MYYIIHPYSSWSHKKPFTNFHSAYMIQQMLYIDSNIVFFDGESQETVWDSKWEVRIG